MAVAGKHGISEKTPEHIQFGAGTIHQNLKYTEGSGWNFADSIIGATNGGSNFSIIPSIFPLELDGALVKFKDGEVKNGEEAKMELNMAELTPDLIKFSTFAREMESADKEYTLLESKPHIEKGDYLDNIAFVGKTLKGRNIIVIMDNALCTSGYNHEAKNKEGAIGKYTFECHGDIESDLDTLPWHIYYPKATA